jgi:hypothetical protein
MIRGLASMARLAWALLDFGPRLALPRRGARLCQLLHLLLPAHVYSNRSGDLHEDANARFN